MSLLIRTAQKIKIISKKQLENTTVISIYM